MGNQLTLRERLEAVVPPATPVLLVREPVVPEHEFKHFAAWQFFIRNRLATHLRKSCSMQLAEKGVSL